MNIFRDILTGPNNETVAIGRFMGVVLLFVVVLVMPIEVITVKESMITVEQWGTMLAQWQVFLPIVVGVSGALIAGTSFTEPKVNDK